MKLFTYSIIVIVAAAIVAGFFIVGSPGAARLRQADTRRENDLSALQNNITYYWQGKQKLPETLADLRDDLRGVTVPVDPETGAVYGYRILSPESFELCATFSLSSQNKGEMAPPEISRPVSVGAPTAENIWTHGSGTTCFERTIDKDFFQPIKK